MKTTNDLLALLEEAKLAGTYWAEEAKLEFAQSLELQLRLAGLTYADVARAIGSSAPYVSKVFRGESNLTIETMVKLAMAVGGQLEIRVVDPATRLGCWDLSRLQSVLKGPQVEAGRQAVNTSWTATSAAANQSKYWSDMRASEATTIALAAA